MLFDDLLPNLLMLQQYTIHFKFLFGYKILIPEDS